MNNISNIKNISDAALRLRAIIDTAIDGIINIDNRGIVESINPAAAKLFGYEPKEIIGKNVSMLMPSPYREEHDGYLERYQSTGKARIIGIGRETKGRRKDGSLFPLRLAVSEVSLGDKTIYTGIIHDLTDVNEAEREVRKLNKELERRVQERTEKLAEVVNKLLATNQRLEKEVLERKAAQEALLETQKDLERALKKEKELGELKSRFVSMASHEFRTPLSAILSSAALVMRYPEKEQQPKREKHAMRIKSAVSNLNGILNDFLSFSKLEEGRIQYRLSAFNLKELTEEVLWEIEGLLKNGQTIVREGKNDDDVIIMDRQILKNILFNLLSNALKYSEEGKNIYCRTKITRKKIIVEVEDEGMGIPEKDKQYLFTRFFRAANATNIQGTGLGLNIVKKYVNLFEGEINFKSELNKGSVFKITIPLLLKSPDYEKNISYRR